MLEGPPGRLGDLSCPIISAEAQLEIKRRFREIRPDGRSGRTTGRTSSCSRLLKRRG
jgi:hypothetical protein